MLVAATMTVAASWVCQSTDPENCEGVTLPDGMNGPTSYEHDPLPSQGVPDAQFHTRLRHTTGFVSFV
jgi:hypothetical protein